MGSMSLWHWLVVILILAVLFGPSRIPQLGKGLGEGIRNFKKGLEGDPEKPADKDTKSDK